MNPHTNCCGWMSRLLLCSRWGHMSTPGSPRNGPGRSDQRVEGDGSSSPKEGGSAPTREEAGAGQTGVTLASQGLNEMLFTFMLLIPTHFL